MPSLVSVIRDRYHPIFHLRKLSGFQRLTRYMDRPVGIHCPAVQHPIYVSLSKNLSLVLSRGDQYGQMHAPERERFIALIKAGGFKRLLDVGANIGLYGFVFQSVAQGGSVLMVEPDPGNAQLIRRTIARSRLKNVKLVEAAAADVDGEVMFYQDELSGATGSIEHRDRDAFVAIHHSYKAARITVPAIKLDGLCSEADPDLMKIDVEGAELAALRGAAQIIERSCPALLFECDENQALVQQFLSDRGYVLFEFPSLQRADAIPHNSLALHEGKHSSIVAAIRAGTFGTQAAAASV